MAFFGLLGFSLLPASPSQAGAWAIREQVQVILQALKKYGIILADNGSSWYISGAPDERWANDMLHELDDVYGSDFEAVDVSSLMLDPNSGQVQLIP